MHRAARYLLRLFTITLAILWLGVGVAWLRSHWRGDSIAWETRSAKPTSPIFAPREDLHQYLILSGEGGIGIVTQIEDRVVSPRPTTQRWEVSTTPQYPRPWPGPVGRAPGRAGPPTTTRVNLPVPSVAVDKMVLTPTPRSTAGTLSLAPAPTSSPPLTDALDMYRLKAPSAAAPAQLPSGSAFNLSAPGVPSSAAGPGAKASDPQYSFQGGAIYADTAINVVGGGSLTVAGGAMRMNIGTLVFNSFALFQVPPPNPVPTGPYRFLTYSGNSTPLRRYRVIIAPYWSILVLTAPLLWAIVMLDARVRRRARRDARGECIRCGYDLRATAHRCPECGLSVPEGHVPLPLGQTQSGEESVSSRG
jgi:hypothetical protein